MNIGVLPPKFSYCWSKRFYFIWFIFSEMEGLFFHILDFDCLWKSKKSKLFPQRFKFKRSNVADVQYNIYNIYHIKPNYYYMANQFMSCLVMWTNLRRNQFGVTLIPNWQLQAICAHEFLCLISFSFCLFNDWSIVSSLLILLYCNAQYI